MNFKIFTFGDSIPIYMIAYIFLLCYRYKHNFSFLLKKQKFLYFKFL